MFNTLKSYLLSELQDSIDILSSIDELQETLENLEIIISDEGIDDYLSDKKKKLEEQLLSLKQKLNSNNVDSIRENYNRIKNAKNIGELGYSYMDVLKLFDEKKLPLVLDESDVIIENQSEFDELEDFVLVHKTRFAPTNDEIKSRTNANVQKVDSVFLGDEYVDVTYPLYRETVHFAVNGEMGNHMSNDLSDARYAIIIPFVDVPNLINFNPCDTYAWGNVDIKKGYLLCPFQEVEELKKMNPNITIIPYKGNSVSGFADKFISLLGYKCECGSKDGWENTSDSKKAINTVQQKTSLTYGSHDSSDVWMDEKIKIALLFLKSIIDKIIEMNKDIDPELITNQLIKDGQFHVSQIETYLIYFCYDGKYFDYLVSMLEQYNIHLSDFILDLQKTIIESGESGKDSYSSFENVLFHEIFSQVRDIIKTNHENVNIKDISR